MGSERLVAQSGESASSLAPGAKPALAFAQTVDQIRMLAEHLGELHAVGSARLVGLASHLSLGQAAAHAGLDLRPHTDFATTTDFIQAATEAGHVFQACFLEPLDDGQASEAMEALRLEILKDLHEVLLAQTVVSRALVELEPGSVLLPTTLDERVAAVVRYEAEQRNIAVRLLAAPKPGAVPEKSRLGLVVQRLAAPLAHNALSLIRHSLRQARERRPVLLAFGSGVDSVNQQRLMPAIEAAGMVHPLLVRPREVEASAFNRPGHLKYPYLYFVALRAMLSSRSYAPQCRRWLERFYDLLKARPDECPHLFANPWLRPYFERIFQYLLPHVLATQRDAGALLDMTHPRLVLTSCEVSFPTRILVSEAKRRRIPTLGLLHSGLSNMLYRDFGSDCMAVWGEVHVRDFVRVLSKEPQQLAPIGNPQYDVALCDPARAQERSPSGTPRILVVTAVPQWQMFHLDLRQHERTWRELERLPELGIQVVIKPHPRFDDYAFYRSLSHQLPDWHSRQPGIALVEDAFLEEALPECDLVVVPNFPTTGAVEAMLCEKPVVYLTCATVEIPFCTSVAAGCLVVREVAHICPAILELLNSPERRAEIVEKGQTYLDELLGPRDGQATQRLTELIAALVSGSGRSKGKPARVQAHQT